MHTSIFASGRARRGQAVSAAHSPSRPSSGRCLAAAAALAACATALTAAPAPAPISGGAARQTHPFSAVDMQSMQRISEPQVSPRGDQVAFVVRSTDFAGNRGTTDLWLVGIDGSGARCRAAPAAARSGASRRPPPAPGADHAPASRAR